MRKRCGVSKADSRKKAGGVQGSLKRIMTKKGKTRRTGRKYARRIGKRRAADGDSNSDLDKKMRYIYRSGTFSEYLINEKGSIMTRKSTEQNVFTSSSLPGVLVVADV
jgi:hypothetical protein